MKWLLLITGATLAYIVVKNSRFSLPTVSIGSEGPTVTPSSAGNP